MLVGAAIGYGLGGFGQGMVLGVGWGLGPNPYSDYLGGWDECETVDTDYDDYDFVDNTDYGYADSGIDTFEAGDNGEGVNFEDFGGDNGGFFVGDGEGYTDDDYGGGYNDSFNGGNFGGDGDFWSDGDFGIDGGACGA